MHKVFNLLTKTEQSKEKSICFEHSESFSPLLASDELHGGAVSLFRPRVEHRISGSKRLGRIFQDG